MSQINDPTDVALVQRALVGDLTAFEILYHRYHASIFRTIQAVVRNYKVAEDLLQECFVRAYRNLDRVDQSVDSLAPWLHRIGLNLAYNWVSRKKPVLPLGEIISDLLVSPRRGPERQAEDAELRRVLREAIDQLDDKYRFVIILCYLEQLSVNEIATRLNIPQGTVKSRLYYARRKLRLALSEDKRVAYLVASYGT